MSKLSAEIIKALGSLDTPTVCNALEVVAPERRARGFTVKPFVCARPTLPPVVGFARTVRIRAMHKAEHAVNMDDYYSYIAEGGPLPGIAVIEDLDEIPGYGAFWGEVHTHVHYGLGCTGVVTNGSIRDLPDSRENFQMLAGMVNPSHAWVHVVDWRTPVNVHGMEVCHDDLIHADQHGAVVIPIEHAEATIEAAERVAARERILIDASKQPGFNMQKMRQAFKDMSEVH